MSKTGKTHWKCHCSMALVMGFNFSMHMWESECHRDAPSGHGHLVITSIPSRYWFTVNLPINIEQLYTRIIDVNLLHHLMLRLNFGRFLPHSTNLVVVHQGQILLRILYAGEVCSTTLLTSIWRGLSLVVGSAALDRSFCRPHTRHPVLLAGSKCQS